MYNDQERNQVLNVVIRLSFCRLERLRVRETMIFPTDN
jgi:hypothetical protein